MTTGVRTGYGLESIYIELCFMGLAMIISYSDIVSRF